MHILKNEFPVYYYRDTLNLYVCVVTGIDTAGNLHFANVEEGDKLGGKDYVCIVQNEKLRGLVQGDDKSVHPVSAGTRTLA